ncbi:MAG: hypothetical protein KDK91_00160 [Gammaproteobacteria bacterium]|nr:hypothetical protein [Gammaproteobacteria bacterium]
MAFEGMFIELMKKNVALGIEEKESLRSLGEELGLKKESVFDVDFWQKFENFIAVDC